MKLAILGAALVLAACSAGGALAPPATPHPPLGLSPAVGIPAGLHPIRTCPRLPSGLTCDAMVMAGPDDSPAGFAVPFGLTPSQLAEVYNLKTAQASSGTPTIGIVALFDDPTLESDMNHYRAAFGIPPCTSASGCFRKVDETGRAETAIPAASGSFPSADANQLPLVFFEASLDVEMVSAACPKCHILVADAFFFDSLPLPAAVGGVTNFLLGINLLDTARAANAAARLGAVAVSSSLGELDGGDPEQPVADRLYNTPGTAQLASTGDFGYGVSYPASSPSVIAVGGTTLTALSGGRFGETAWPDAGSGCSVSEPKPAWQRDALCGNRMVGDVSADADPRSGVAVYDSYGQTDPTRGWFLAGGTSASSPFIAGVIGLAGNGATMGPGASYLYAHASGFRDIQGGQNKKGCGDYTCRGDVGYDGPTGLGVPNGTSGL